MKLTIRDLAADLALDSAEDTEEIVNAVVVDVIYAERRSRFFIVFLYYRCQSDFVYSLILTLKIGISCQACVKVYFSVYVNARLISPAEALFSRSRMQAWNFLLFLCIFGQSLISFESGSKAKVQQGYSTLDSLTSNFECSQLFIVFHLPGLSPSELVSYSAALEFISSKSTLEIMQIDTYPDYSLLPIHTHLADQLQAKCHGNMQKLKPGIQ